MDDSTLRDGLAAAQSVLEHVRCLLADPQRWQHFGVARDGLGQWTPADSPTAVSWSLSGALERTALSDIAGFGGQLPQSLAKVALTSAVLRVRPDAPAWWRFAQFEQSPDTTHAHVLDLLGEAIAILRRS